MQIPSDLELFVDTNIFLYSITIHSKYGKLCGKFFDRIKAGELKGKISVLILNELIHKLIIGEVSEERGIKPFQAIQYIKKNPRVLSSLKVFEVIEDVESNYNLTIVDVKREHFALAQKMMQEYHLLSNDALYLAVMKKENITDIATYDSDFEKVKGIRIWKP